MGEPGESAGERGNPGLDFIRPTPTLSQWEREHPGSVFTAGPLFRSDAVGYGESVGGGAARPER